MTPALAIGPNQGGLALFYSSSNGDRWFLGEDAPSGQKFVQHEPNLSSGGVVSVTKVADVLPGDGQGPQHEALRRLLG